jgi:hypothetical protein
VDKEQAAGSERKRANHQLKPPSLMARRESRQTKQRKLVITISMVTLLSLTGTVGILKADNGTCNGANVALPFMDVAGNPFFCQIAAAYFSGLTNGTSATTYSPANNVTREQMAAFVTRTLDQSLKRGSQRAAINRWWTTQFVPNFNTEKLILGSNPYHAASDGRYVYATSYDQLGVGAVRKYALDGEIDAGWDVPNPKDLINAGGRLWVTGDPFNAPGKLHRINPKSNDSTDFTTFNLLYSDPHGIACDGQRLWIAFGSGHVGTYNLQTGQTSYFTSGFVSPRGILFDGTSIWVTDTGDNKLKRLNPDGTINFEVAINSPQYPVFDGTNIWVPAHNSVVVVRAAATDPAKAILATHNGNGLSTPIRAAFDGERILVTNYITNSVTLFKATDLSVIGNFPVGQFPWGVCNDGLNFWVVLQGEGKVARF